jgi:hypothetical protein
MNKVFIVKFVSIFLITFVVSACSDSPFPSKGLEGHSPYGIWVTGRGHVIVIARDKSYIYCEKESCMQGVIETYGAYGVTLKGFMNNPATQSLRVESEEDEIRDTSKDLSADYDFTEKGSGMSKELRNARCNNLPCVTIGALDTNYVYRFVKTEDF